MGAPLPASGSRRVSRIGAASHRGGDRRLGGRRNARRRQAWLEGPTEDEKQRWIRRETGGVWEGLPSVPVMETRSPRRGRSTAARGGSGGKGFSRRAGARAVGHLVLLRTVGPEVRRRTLPTASTAPRQILNRLPALPTDSHELVGRPPRVRIASRQAAGILGQWPTSDADGNRRTSRIENHSRPRLISARAEGDRPSPGNRTRVARHSQPSPRRRRAPRPTR